MKLRPILLIVLLVGGFWFVTTHWSSPVEGFTLGRFTFPGFHGAGSALELTEAEAAGRDR